MGIYVSHISSELRNLSNNYIELYNNWSKEFSGFRAFFLEQLYIQTGFLVSLAKQGVSRVYVPNPPVPFLSSIPIVLTIPDLSFIFDLHTSLTLKVYLWISYFLSAHKAAGITTFSKNSALDISKWLMVDSKKINIISPAVSYSLKIQKPSRKKITSSYILTVPGTFVARKNMLDVAIAVKNLKGFVPKVVVVGQNSGADYENFVRYIHDQKISDKFIFVGRVEDHELANLYSHAKLVVYPSLYEGFGLPPLEAMYFHVPTICYHNSSLPEIVGKAGLLVGNARQLSKAIKSVLTNPKLRKKMIAKGILREKQFSWKKSASILHKQLNSYVI